MGIFYETRNTNVSTQAGDTIFSAFPTHSIPLTLMGYDEYKALRNSDLWTAVTLLSRDIAKLDIRVKDNGVYKDKDRLELLLNKTPNPYMNGYMLKYIVMMNALLTGHGFIKIERKGSQVTELYHVPTSNVMLKEDKKGNFYYEINSTGGTAVYDYKDMIDIKPFTLDGINALKVLDAIEDDMNTQRFTKNFFTKFFANGGQNSGLLKVRDGKLNQQARNKLRDEFTKANAGENNAGKVLVLDSTLDYEQLEIDSSLLDVINKNQTPTKAIAKAFQIPLSKFGIELSNTSLKDVNNDYLTNCLGGYMKTIEAELNFKLVSDKDQYTKEFKFDSSSFRMIDWDSYVETLNTQLEKGAITHDEYRYDIGREPFPDNMGAVPRFDLNHISANVADDYQLRKTSTNNQSPNPDTSERGEKIE
ncbi:phage portal protein [Staphylococcus gallinarum]|uniref:phage portal protein n=2 Tax=Staphylococcus gallinarum TaxID=1293 RepID=UPI000D1FA3A0|nr:phage portal protein [Staphylococcus gallinarum]PTL18498.1 phage portal protein [Staphylococcus gallinarum]RIL23777.1 phage portal protein [Staphylococcus gallinarum]RIO80045.1 phage portal protein [Staphylococcus gallinarum]RIO87706.1 phage portal protein [Staphylococcus gallinarum]